MMKRMMFLAAGLAASLAFATPSDAGSVLVTFSVTGGTAMDISLQYAVATTVTIGANTGIGSAPTILNNDTTAVTINFGSPTTSSGGSVYLTDTSTTGAPPTLYGLSGLSTGYTASTITVVPTSVPEPGTMALLGIGMTSFLAFRRFFKRAPVA